MSALSATESLNRHILALGSLAILLVGGVGGWAATTELSNAVIGQGTVIVDDTVKKIQHLTDGVVSELLVSEGMHVRSGQVLIRLDGAVAKAELAILNNTLAQLYVRRSRLEAERAGADSVHVPTDLARFGIDTRTLIEGEEKFFASRRSSLAGMKKQFEERKAQLREEIKGQTQQLKSIADAMKLATEESDITQDLFDRRLVTLQRLNALKRQRVAFEGEQGSEPRHAPRRKARSMRSICKFCNSTRISELKSPRTSRRPTPVSQRPRNDAGRRSTSSRVLTSRRRWTGGSFSSTSITSTESSCRVTS